MAQENTASDMSAYSHYEKKIGSSSLTVRHRNGIIISSCQFTVVSLQLVHTDKLKAESQKAWF